MKFHTLILAVALATAPTLSPAAGAATGEVQWARWDTGLKSASASNRPILVDVYTDWCGWCKRMDRDVYSRDDVRAYLNQHFILVRLNAESADEASFGGRTLTSRALAQQLRVSGYPTTIFLKANGDHIANV